MIPKVIGIAILATTVLSGAVMLLWNGILVNVLHIGIISFWQAAGILLLSKILFGGFRGRHMGGWHMKKRMFMKWESMTPEQRDEFRSRMHSCGRGWNNNEVQATAS